MKRILLKTCILLTMCFIVADTNAQTKDLYLIIGQSNAGGRDTNIDTNGPDSDTNDVDYFTDDGKIVKAKQPLNQHSSIRKDLDLQGVNLGLQFGKTMKAHNDNDVLLVVNARGGTNLNAWKKDNFSGYFDEAVDRVKEAQDKCKCHLKGILWHQGESNINVSTGTYTNDYFNVLKDMIEDFRDELGDVPFIVGQIADKDSNDAFNDDIKKVDDSNFGVENVDWVSSSGLSTYDGTHFDAASTRTLGERYAEAMQDYIKVVHIRKRNASNFAIDGNHGGDDGQDVYMWSQDNGNVNQQWVELNLGDGYYAYQKKNTKYCLDGNNGGAPRQNVYLWTCDNFNENQMWQKINKGSGYVQLKKRNASYVIDGGSGGRDGQNIQLWRSSTSHQNTQWSISEISSNNLRVAQYVGNGLSIDLTIYPNPSTGELSVDISDYMDKKVDVVISDLLGKVLRTQSLDKYHDQILNINISALQNGVYMLSIKIDGYKVVTKKVSLIKS